MKRMSFKMHIAVFTGIIVLTTALSLTLVSMYSAGKQINYAVSVQPEDTDTNGASVRPVDADVNMPGLLQSAEIVEVGPVVPDRQYSTITLAAKEATHNYNTTSIITMILVAAAGMAGAYIFAGKSMKPLRELNDTVSRITEKDLNMRLPERETNDEISNLTNAFNTMLNRLEAAFNHQEQFSQNAAHELKTPVTVIKTGIQTLQLDENPSAEEYKEVFAIISRNTERLADIIDDLLMLTNKNRDFPAETVSINALLIGIVRDIMPHYRKKDIKVNYEFQCGECFLECAETLTYRLFYNLIENAFKYNRQGGVLTIGITEGTDRYIIRIKDTGIGIPEQELAHIWDAFYCVDPSRSKKMGGVGLGLSIVKELADRFGWKISVTAKENEGTEFTVECGKASEGC